MSNQEQQDIKVGKTLLKNYQQKIYFGCPGTGKSHRVNKNCNDSKQIRCVFHPEYSYGDFMGKLMPITRGGKVSYQYYSGHFMKALAQAYENLSNQVVLVIDEINRGNTAAIFGSVLQLLDRDGTGCSSYAINLSDMELEELVRTFAKGTFDDPSVQNLKDEAKLAKVIEILTAGEGNKLNGYLTNNGEIKLPPNLSIVGTMNTSDESIYYMDSAFKRRWDWEYIAVDHRPEESEENAIKLDDMKLEQQDLKWCVFVDRLNTFIKDQAGSIRRVEDKQIGYWFIKAEDEKIKTEQIKNKLMFFLWDSVFQRDKTPLEKLLPTSARLITFGDFSDQVEGFIACINSYPVKTEIVEDSSD